MCKNKIIILAIFRNRSTHLGKNFLKIVYLFIVHFSQDLSKRLNQLKENLTDYY